MNSRIALYGVGHWHADMHLRAFAKAGGEIVALGDPDKQVLWHFQPEWKGPRFTSLSELLEECGPGFVMVMGKPVDMLESATSLVAAGVPFGIEKPLGRVAEESRGLVERVEEAGLFAAVPLVNRYSRIWERLDQSLGSGGDERPVHAHFRIINGTAERYRAAGVGWVLDPRAHGGGALRNLGIHAADAFLRLCGDVEYSVRAARLAAPSGEEADEFAVALLESANGLLATIEAGYTYPTTEAGGDFEWRIATRRSYLLDRNDRLESKAFDVASTTIERNITQDERYASFAQDVLGRLASGRPPLVSLRDAWRAMVLVDRAYEAAGRQVSEGLETR